MRHRSTQLVQLLILCNRSRDVLRIVMGLGPDIGPISGAVLWQGAVSSPSSAISRDHLLLSDRASISNTLIVTARPARQHGLSLWGWWVAPLSTKTITETLHQDDQRTHIPRLVSLPCRCTTLLPGTLSKMTINKMTFNRKVKIGSLLTAWHRYLVIDLYITIPNLRGGGERTIYTQRSLQTRETAAHLGG